jgi:hypothetical protein
VHSFCGELYALTSQKSRLRRRTLASEAGSDSQPRGHARQSCLVGPFWPPPALLPAMLMAGTTGGAHCSIQSLSIAHCRLDAALLLWILGPLGPRAVGHARRKAGTALAPSAPRAPDLWLHSLGPQGHDIIRRRHGHPPRSMCNTVKARRQLANLTIVAMLPQPRTSAIIAPSIYTKRSQRGRADQRTVFSIRCRGTRPRTAGCWWPTRWA